MMNVFLRIYFMCFMCYDIITSLDAVECDVVYHSVRDDFYNCSSGDSRAGYTVYFEFLNCMAIDMS